MFQVTDIDPSNFVKGVDTAFAVILGVSFFLLIVITLVIAGAMAGGVVAEELATGELEIRGAVLNAAPAFQEVAPGLPT